MYVYIENGKNTGRFNCRGVLAASDDPHSLAYQLEKTSQRVFGSTKLVGTSTNPRRPKFTSGPDKGKALPDEVTEKALVDAGAKKFDPRHSGG